MALRGAGSWGSGEVGVSVPVGVLVLDDLRMLATMAAAPKTVASKIAGKYYLIITKMIVMC